MNKKMMIVDDNDMLRIVMRRMVLLWAKNNQIELDLLLFENGQQAFNYLQDNDLPDCLLLDVRMPEMSGPEFLQQTSKIGKKCDAVTIIITGYAEDIETYFGSNPNNINHLRKPFKVAALHEKLSEVMQPFLQ